MLSLAILAQLLAALPATMAEALAYFVGFELRPSVKAATSHVGGPPRSPLCPWNSNEDLYQFCK